MFLSPFKLVKAYQMAPKGNTLIRIWDGYTKWKSITLLHIYILEYSIFLFTYKGQTEEGYIGEVQFS